MLPRPPTAWPPAAYAGVPNSGKSEWIDALMMNLSEQYGWGFALCSLEKTPDKHAIQLIEKVGHWPRMSQPPSS